MENNKVGKKGFIITVDSFLGITLAFIFVILAFGFVSLVQIDSWNSIDLKNSVSDLSSIFESQNIISIALLSYSTEGVLDILNATPPSVCFESIVFDSELSIVLHSIKTGCNKNSNQVLSAERLIVVNDGVSISFFVSRVNGWFK